MRMLSNGFSTAATSVAARAAGGSSFGQQSAYVIESVAVSGGSSAASTVGVILRYGVNSTDENSLVLCAGDSSDVTLVIPNLGLKANVWEVTLPTTSARGWAVIVSGN